MSTTTWLEQGTGAEEQRLEILVITPEALATFDVPTTGLLTLGRDPEASIQLTDRAASARHARLLVGVNGSCEIEDLGSKNGTSVRGQRLTAGERVALALGEAISIGSTTVMLQRPSRRTLTRRVWPHGYFEARLEEHCELFEDTSAAFSVARIDLDKELQPARLAALAAPALARTDILAAYGPRSFEILMPYSEGERARSTVNKLATTLLHQGWKSRQVVACYPRDGRTAGALLGQLSAQLRPSEGGAKVAAPFEDVVVLDEQMRRLFATTKQKIGPGPLNVLILGETGVGKEVLAASIHHASPRVSKPYICLNCAAFTESLLESELFGYEKGAFTDARTAKPGLLESANGGTVFLDEIGEMSPTLQVKILRVLDTKQVTRVGALRPTTLDVRFVAATHRDLQAEIRQGRFRSDLYFRLNGITLHIPPLRQRRSEIRPLAERFIEATCRHLNRRAVPRLSERALQVLENHAWPGNIRELRNVVERGVVLSDDGGDIDVEHLSMETLTAPLALVQERTAEGSIDPRDRWNQAERDERQQIVEALEQAAGNQSRAAKELGIARGTLIARIKYFDIPRPHASGSDG